MHFLAVCIIFLALLIAEYKLKFLPMMSSDADNAPGTVYYAVAMSVMAFISMFIPQAIYPFGIGVLCTSLGDGLAGVVGMSVKRFNPRIYGSKTLMGAAANLITSFTSALIFSSIFSVELEIWHCVLIALFSVILELFVAKGLDNITIALGTAALTYALLYMDGIENYLLPILLTPVIIAFSYKKKALTVSAIIGAVILDVAVSLVFGNLGFLMLCAFFIGAVLVDKIKPRRSHGRANEVIRSKGAVECRTLSQVFANGLAAMLAAMLFALTKKEIFILAFAATLAEAFSDTCASAVGSLSKKTFDPFRWTSCDTGVSGGMSLPGTLAAAVSALLISLIPYAFGVITFMQTFIVAFSAFLGAVFDSLLGSLLQVKYKCSVCAKIVESPEHCGKRAEKNSGFYIINNNVVNLISTFVAAAFSSALFLLI